MSYADRPSRSRRDYHDHAPPADYDDPPPRRKSKRDPGPIDPPPLHDGSQVSPTDTGPPSAHSNPSKPRSAMRDPSRPRGERRSNSQVRLRPEPDNADHDDDSDGSVVGKYVRHRDGRVDFIPDDSKARRRSMPPPRDAERKTNPENRRFRERRSGYDSDEGDAMKRSRRRSHDDRGGGHTRMPAVNGSHNYDLPERPRRRYDDDDGATLAAGAGAAAGYGAAHGRRREPRYDDDDDYPPRRGPGGGGRPRPKSHGYDDRGYDRGYDSERPHRRSSHWDDEDPYARRSHGGGGRDPYDDRGGRPPRRRYDDDDRMPRRSKTQSDRRPADERGPPGKQDWKSTGMDLFKTHAVPVIKHEGGRLLMKQLERMAQGR